jgi:hypothetical protein
MKLKEVEARVSNFGLGHLGSGRKNVHVQDLAILIVSLIDSIADKYSTETVKVIRYQSRPSQRAETRRREGRRTA